MYVAVVHRINDTEAMLSRGDRLGDPSSAPPGVVPRQFCPSIDLSAATCVCGKATLWMPYGSTSIRRSATRARTRTSRSTRSTPRACLSRRPRRPRSSPQIADQRPRLRERRRLSGREGGHKGCDDPCLQGTPQPICASKPSSQAGPSAGRGTAVADVAAVVPHPNLSRDASHVGGLRSRFLPEAVA